MRGWRRRRRILFEITVQRNNDDAVSNWRMKLLASRTLRWHALSHLIFSIKNSRRVLHVYTNTYRFFFFFFPPNYSSQWAIKRQVPCSTFSLLHFRPWRNRAKFYFVPTLKNQQVYIPAEAFGWCLLIRMQTTIEIHTIKLWRSLQRIERLFSAKYLCSNRRSIRCWDSSFHVNQAEFKMINGCTYRGKRQKHDETRQNFNINISQRVYIKKKEYLKIQKVASRLRFVPCPFLTVPATSYSTTRFDADLLFCHCCSHVSLSWRAPLVPARTFTHTHSLSLLSMNVLPGSNEISATMLLFSVCKEKIK